jgi:hypothetical protein
MGSGPVLNVIGWIAGIGGILSILWFIWYAARPHDERHAEDDARAFFDEHGHWPDEPPPTEDDAAVAPPVVPPSVPGQLPSHVRAERR